VAHELGYQWRMKGDAVGGGRLTYADRPTPTVLLVLHLGRLTYTTRPTPTVVCCLSYARETSMMSLGDLSMKRLSVKSYSNRKRR
jgi:hypothetical protein